MSALGLALPQVTQTADRLSRLSRRSYQNPYSFSEWPQHLEPDQDWFTTPEYVSLHGTEVWARLDEPARRRVAFHEAAGFYSLNIHGEKSLMQGLAARLYRSDLMEIADYLHHFLDEENKHSVYFGGFCARYARLHRSRQAPFGTPRGGDVDDFMFFARTLIFEEIVDHYNRVQARDRRLHPLSRFITASWREYYHPDVYADAGLPDPWELAETAWCNPAQRAHRRKVSTACLRFLMSTGILVEEPADAF
jgi:hypothetical protein